MAPRPLQPPSSYRPATAAQPAPQPTAAGAPSTSSRRLSRTELDFEQALRTGGTVLLKEERDFSSLGKVDSPSALSTISASPAGSPYYDYSFMSPSSPTPNSSRLHQQTPATVKRNNLAAPSVVPPTPTSTTHSNNHQVAAPTPTTIHITTTAAATSSSSSSRPGQPPTPSPSSSNDVFFDADDGDMQTRRRSMYRASGTSSSPDLATLLRKTKEKGCGNTSGSATAAAIAAARNRDRRYDQRDLGPPPPLPGSTSAGLFPPSPAGMRQRSSTAVGGLGVLTSPQATPMRTKKDSFGPASPDWVLTSKASKQSLREIKGKTSVRQKATAFVGRVLGQGSSRDRSLQRTEGGISSSDAPSRSSHSLFDAFAPPVPPIPHQHRTSPTPPISDIFSQSQHPTTSKPLPPIIKPFVEAPSDGETTEPEDFLRSPTRKPRPPSDQTIGKWRPDASSETVTARHNKRRSMSVGEMELKLAMSAASSMTPLPSTTENTSDRDRSTPQPSRHQQQQSAASRAGYNRDPSLKGIISDFQGELLQLDAPSTASFDLKDPSTPARRAALARSRTEADATTFRPSLFSRSQQQQPHKSQTAPLLPTTTTTGLQSAVAHQGVDRASLADSLKSASTSSGGQDGMAGSVTGQAALVPPRTSSSSLRAADITHPALAAAVGSTTGPPTTNTNARTRTQLTASSEPSLLPDVRLVSSSGASSVGGGGGGSSIGIGGSSSASSSRVDFSSSASIASSDRLGRYPSSSYARRRRTMSQDGLDMDAKGRDLAGKCWAEDEEFLMKEKIAEWLGGHGRINKIALRYYMEFFDFSGLRLDNAFRRLCEKLYLKAETQQVDRILDEFSKRYWDCNPGTLYGSASVVHSVSYSLLLLNTDLHVAELSTRMSRNQFVRNTMSTIQMSLEPQPTTMTATSSSINLSRPSNVLRLSSSDLTYDDCASSIRGEELEGNTVRTKRSSSVASWNSGSRDTALSSPPTEYSPAPGNGAANGNSANGGGGSSAAASSTSVLPTTTVAFSGPGGPDTKSTDGNGHGHGATTTTVSSAVYGRLWETEMENLLKEMYSAIKSQQILQPQGSMIGGRTSTSVLGPGQGHALLRKGSVRGGPPDRLTSLKRGSIRGLHSIMGNQAGVSPYSSNSSIDGRSSPAPSFANSAHEALQSNPAFMAPTLGFASNLSHTIIRELQEDDDHSVKSHETGSTEISITDEELALLGAPWAKEGNLCRKQYWESTGKRSKDRNWLDVFVVIQRGELNMFVFGDHHAASHGVVGGGNWLENANTVGTIQLAHSLAHALPPPGYNRQRPYCMVLTQSNGGLYFFQAGTEELVKEWVDTCNYWAARTSREPLAGGVSNMEYGWNRVLSQQRQHPQGRAVSDSDSMHAPEPADNFDTASVRSGRSSRSRFGGRREASALRTPGSPFSDRMFINDWTPPMPSMVPSTHDEEGQYEALKRHVESLKTELEKHNELRSPMMALYQPRTTNANKAQNNWEKKSQYLLAEIIKYESYIDSLHAAMLLRLKRRGDKALERALVVASPDEGSEDQAHTEINHGTATVKAGKNGRWRSGSNVESIEEVNTPPETPQAPQFNVSRMHRREVAEAGV